MLGTWPYVVQSGLELSAIPLPPILSDEIYNVHYQCQAYYDLTFIFILVHFS